MKKRLLFILLLVLALSGVLAQPAAADGIIIPPPCPLPNCPPPPPCPGFDCPPFPPRPITQLVIRYHHVDVSIQDQIAVTKVDQVFYNPNDWAIEGTYLFPLPRDAVVSNFTLWVDDQPVEGKVLGAEEARRIYEEITRELRDPALLEYAGRGAVQASIFPIPPRGERRVQLEYTQALTAQNGLVQYHYPLSTEQFSVLPLEDVRIRVEVQASQSIRAVYSPSHPVAVERPAETRAIAGYEAQNVRPDTDFALYYSLGESEAFHLFSYRDPGDPAGPDGFFMLLLAPKPGTDTAPIAKDVLLVLDRSGSMDGEKFQQAQAALRYVLRNLNREDRFYLQSFSTGVEAYASGLRPASEAAQALRWVDQLNAAGSTDINRALLEAAAVVDKERPTYLIFLTDGLPTEGVVDTPEILKNFAQSAPRNLRVFPFGVGYDVDTILLDTLSQEHHGQSSYVRPGEPLDEAISVFYERISTPALTDIALDFGSLNVYDVYPNPLPDLFSGGQVIVAGRYRLDPASSADLVTDIRLSGEVNGQPQTFHYPQQRFAADSRAVSGSLAALPRLWATRKIGYLLNRIRLDGPDQETIQQIVQLSVRYGIVTPYTSYLVTEPAPLGAQTQAERSLDAFQQAQSAPGMAYGQDAVERAAEAGKMQSADVAPQAPSQSMGGGTPGGMPGSGAPEGAAQAGGIRIVGARTFIYQQGAWLDTAFDPQAMTAQVIPFLSDDYFNLLAARPDLAAALALGDQLTLVVDGQAYQVTTGSDVSGPVTLPPAITAAPTTPSAGEPSATLTPPVIAQNATPAPTPTPAGSPSAPRSSGCPSVLIPLGLALGVPLFLKARRSRASARADS